MIKRPVTAHLKKFYGIGPRVRLLNRRFCRMQSCNPEEAFQDFGDADIVSARCLLAWSTISVTRLGDLLDFGQVFKAFGNN